MKVQVKWGKEVFNDVEVDISQPPIVFKSQLFALTSVTPDRQKVMIKGGLVKDDDWGKQVPKEGQTVMLMGSAEALAVEAPKAALTFLEDLPESEQTALASRQYGAGLQNLGNTCYMNSTLQCLYAIKPLRSALSDFRPVAASDPSNKLVEATRDLFRSLEKGIETPPYMFWQRLKEKFPQFQQQTNEGAYMQQDAEECWTNMVYALRERLKDEQGRSVVEKLLGVGMKLKLKCEETNEELEEASTNYMLKCNITIDVNHLHDGILLGLKDDREKNSTALGRLAMFHGASVITSLPQFLPVQLVRFAYKASVNQKAKVLRKVSYPMELDVYPYCGADLQAALDAPRAQHKAAMDREVEERKKPKIEPSGAAAATTAAAEAPALAAAAGDVDMADASASGANGEAGPSSSSASTAEPQLTGKYTLSAVLTHKGRSADSGHYVAWVRQHDDTWVLFDDDQLIPKTPDEVLNLAGGGDWHMAYLLIYKAVTVPAVTVTAS